MLDLFLVRHAESEMNHNIHLISGRSNEVNISPRGVKQAKLLGQKFKEQNQIFDRFYVSAAVRTQETMRLILEEMELAIEPSISEEIVEMSQGDWEGKERVKIYSTEVLAQIQANQHDFKAPNGESQRDVEHRMLKWAENELIPDSLHQDIRVLVITHGTAIKCCLRGILDSNPAHTYKTNIDNTSVTRLVHKENGWHLVKLNDNSHLAPDDYIPHQPTFGKNGK